MSDKEPTEAQIKEFWEWCKAPIFDIMAYDIVSKQHYPDKLYPTLDLNNLFKYAVPKLIDKYGGILFVLPQVNIKSWECKILNKPSDEATFGYDNDPALALFWAIYQVMHKEVTP